MKTLSAPAAVLFTSIAAVGVGGCSSSEDVTNIDDVEPDQSSSILTGLTTTGSDYVLPTIIETPSTDPLDCKFSDEFGGRIEADHNMLVKLATTTNSEGEKDFLMERVPMVQDGFGSLLSAGGDARRLGIDDCLKVFIERGNYEVDMNFGDNTSLDVALSGSDDITPDFSMLHPQTGSDLYIQFVGSNRPFEVEFGDLDVENFSLRGWDTTCNFRGEVNGRDGFVLCDNLIFADDVASPDSKFLAREDAVAYIWNGGELNGENVEFRRTDYDDLNGPDAEMEGGLVKADYIIDGQDYNMSGGEMEAGIYIGIDGDATGGNVDALVVNVNGDIGENFEVGPNVTQLFAHAVKCGFLERTLAEDNVEVMHIGPAYDNIRYVVSFETPPCI